MCAVSLICLKGESVFLFLLFCGYISGVDIVSRYLQLFLWYGTHLHNEHSYSKEFDHSVYFYTTGKQNVTPENYAAEKFENEKYIEYVK